MPKFLVEIGGDAAPLTRTLSQLGGDLRTFKQQLKSATTVNDVERLNAAIKQTETEIKRINKLGTVIPTGAVAGINGATTALTNLGRVAQDAPFGFLGIANNLNPLLESFQRLRAETGSNALAMKALGSSLLGPGGIGLALSVVSSLLIVFGDRLFKASKQVDELKKKQEEYRNAIDNAFASTAKEVVQVGTLISVLRSETETRERRLQAIKELQKISPEIFNGLKLEAGAVLGLDAAYKTYLDNLKNVIAVKILQAKLDQLIEQQLRKQGSALTGADALGTLQSTRQELQRLQELQKSGGIVNPAMIAILQGQIAKSEKELNGLNSQIEETFRRIQELSKGVKISDPSDTKKEEDALKKRLAALEKLKSLTTDINALVGIQESIFEVQVKIAVRDQGKNQLSDKELQQVIKGYQAQLNEAFLNQAIALEAIPKITFTNISRVEIPPSVTDKISKATGLEKITITLHNVRVRILGEKVTAEIEGKEAINAKLSQQINETFENLKLDSLTTLGETIGNAISGGNFGDALKAGAQQMLSIIGGVMVQLGKYVISAALQIQALKKTLSQFAISNPALAIVGGVALIAAGTALKNVAFEGPKFAQGAIATGPTIGMFGEAGKEAIIPLDRLPSLMGKMQGGGNMNVSIRLGIKGRELIAFIDRERTKYNRLS